MKTVDVPKGVSVHIQPIRALNKCPESGHLETVEFEVWYTCNNGIGVELGSLRAYLTKTWKMHVEALAFTAANDIAKLIGTTARVRVGLVEGLTTTSLTKWSAEYAADVNH